MGRSGKDSGTTTANVPSNVPAGDQRGVDVDRKDTPLSARLREPWTHEDGKRQILCNEAADAIDALSTAARHAIFPLEWAREHIDPIVRGKVQRNIDAINDALAKTRVA